MYNIKCKMQLRRKIQRIFYKRNVFLYKEHYKFPNFGKTLLYRVIMKENKLNTINKVKKEIFFFKKMTKTMVFG